MVRGGHGILVGAVARADAGGKTNCGAIAFAKARLTTREVNVTFLKRRISAAVWELLLLLLIAVIFATVYRIYFSRAVALTQVCERLETMQNSETADMFDKLSGDAADSFKEMNRICQVRRPMRQ
jgi:hypothetical protein